LAAQDEADIFNRVIFPNDPSVQYPHVDTEIPLWTVPFMSVMGPIVAALLHQLRRRSLHDLHDAALGATLAGLLTAFFCYTLKPFTGKPRPNWLATQGNDDSRKSYPSAHAAVMMAGMVFLALYLGGKIRIFRPGYGRVWKLILFLGPIYAALIVGLTRTRDYHHDFSDVNGGFFIGFVCGLAAYFIYYPSLFSCYCDLPNNRLYDRFKDKRTRAKQETKAIAAGAAAAAATAGNAPGQPAETA
jgi:membrane-associated phospholipid phosphatase